MLHEALRKCTTLKGECHETRGFKSILALYAFYFCYSCVQSLLNALAKKSFPNSGLPVAEILILAG